MIILMVIVAGLIATAGMTGFLWSVDRTGWANADMVRAVGSLITKSYHNALGVGLTVHFINGVIIAAVYFYVFSLVVPVNLVSEIVLGGVMGFAQGFVVSLGIIRLAYRHPVEAFQDADYKVAAAHLVAHVVYGLLVGAAYGLLLDAGLVL